MHAWLRIVHASVTRTHASCLQAHLFPIVQQPTGPRATCCSTTASYELIPCGTSHCCHTGSRDKSVIVWDIASAAPLAKLEAHTYQVTAVGALPSGEIVSAALDK